MNLTIIGTGFVGVVSSAVFASFGNTVVGLDIDPKRIEKLRVGKVPFYEPGLEELLVRTQKEGNLKFTTSYEEAISNADVIIIAVGTPSAPDGQADLKYVFASCESLAPFMKEGAIIALKSTVPPGTGARVKEVIASKTQKNFTFASLPEFLREGTAVQDTIHPDRVVIGVEDEATGKTLQELHKPFNAPVQIMNPQSAQMCKYSANAYLATRITFINQIADLCEQNGANIQEVIAGIGMDKRIGSHYWYPGLGYGGSCFPKDVKELAAYARSVGLSSNLMVAIDALNEERIPQLLARFGKEIGGWKGKHVALLGLSFKPNTDDMREAPSTRVIPQLLKQGAIVRGYDPMANEAARQWCLSQEILENDAFRIVSGVDDAVGQADAILILTEWEELNTLDLSAIASQAKPNALFVDSRDYYDPKQVVAAGMRYQGIGISL